MVYGAFTVSRERFNNYVFNDYEFDAIKPEFFESLDYIFGTIGKKSINPDYDRYSPDE